jgi:hypothetical protein
MKRWRDPARLLAALSALAVICPASAEAQRFDRADQLARPYPAPTPTSEWAVDVMVATAFPTVLGGNVRVETPGRLLIDVLAGGNPYGDSLGGLVEAYGGGASGHALVTGIASNAGILRLQAGWRPSPDAGLEILAGYSLMYSSPHVTRATLEAVTGQSFAYSSFDSTDLHVTIHGISAELGWRFVIADHVVLRIGAGGTFTVASSAHLDVPDEMRMASPAVGNVESDIAGAITRYGFVPEARVAVGYRF